MRIINEKIIEQKNGGLTDTEIVVNLALPIMLKYYPEFASKLKNWINGDRNMKNFNEFRISDKSFNFLFIHFIPHKDHDKNFFIRKICEFLLVSIIRNNEAERFKTPFNIQSRNIANNWAEEAIHYILQLEKNLY